MKKSKDLLIQLAFWAITAIVDYLCSSERPKRRNRRRSADSKRPNPPK